MNIRVFTIFPIKMSRGQQFLGLLILTFVIIGPKVKLQGTKTGLSQGAKIWGCGSIKIMPGEYFKGFSRLWNDSNAEKN